MGYVFRMISIYLSIYQSYLSLIYPLFSSHWHAHRISVTLVWEYNTLLIDLNIGHLSFFALLVSFPQTSSFSLPFPCFAYAVFMALPNQPLIPSLRMYWVPTVCQALENHWISSDEHRHGTCLPFTISKPISWIQKVERGGEGWKYLQELLTLNTVSSAHQPEKQILPERPPFFLQWGYSIRGVKCSSSSLLRREKGWEGNPISFYSRGLSVRERGEEFLLIPAVFLGSVECLLGIGYN